MALIQIAAGTSPVCDPTEAAHDGGHPIFHWCAISPAPATHHREKMHPTPWPEKPAIYVSIGQLDAEFAKFNRKKSQILASRMFFVVTVSWRYAVLTVAIASHMPVQNVSNHPGSVAAGILPNLLEWPHPNYPDKFRH